MLSLPEAWNWVHRHENPPQALVMPATYFDFMRQAPLRQALAHPTAATRQELDWLLKAYPGRLLPSGHLSTDPTEAARLYAAATAELGATPARDQAMYALFTG